MFESVFKIRATQVDMFGHLNNAKFLELFEWARWDMHDGRGGVDVDFKAEVRVGETVKIRSRIGRIGNRSVTLVQDMFKEDGRLAARANFVWTFMDFQTRKAAPMPDDLRRMYEEWQQQDNQPAEA